MAVEVLAIEVLGMKVLAVRVLAIDIYCILLSLVTIIPVLVPRPIYFCVVAKIV